jgi:transposase
VGTVSYCTQDPFFIRIKENLKVPFEKDNHKALKAFFSHLGNDQERFLYKAIADHDLTVVGKKLPSGEFLIVCSNVKNPKNILKTYKARWSIETMFRNMKNQGFGLEKTHMTFITRLTKLMAVVAVAVLLSSLVGLTLECPFKKTVSSPLFSIFTRGLRWIKYRHKRPPDELNMLIEKALMSIF